MGSVIERRATTVRDGCIEHDDRPSTFDRAEAICGHRLDRRKRYAIIDGDVCTIVQWSDTCSGCYERDHDYPDHNARGMGCPECCYRGRVRRSQWVPMLSEDPRRQRKQQE